MSGYSSNAEVVATVKETIRTDCNKTGMSTDPADYNIAAIVRENFRHRGAGYGERHRYIRAHGPDGGHCLTQDQMTAPEWLAVKARLDAALWPPRAGAGHVGEQLGLFDGEASA